MHIMETAAFVAFGATEEDNFNTDTVADPAGALFPN
jgi:hypothetical protein